MKLQCKSGNGGDDDALAASLSPLGLQENENGGSSSSSSRGSASASRDKSGAPSQQLQLYSFCCCSYCHLPPTPSNNNKKLLTCSNCKSAFYHNTTCQKLHWKQHRRTCQLLSKAMLPLKQLSRWNSDDRFMKSHSYYYQQQQQQQLHRQCEQVHQQVHEKEDGVHGNKNNITHSSISKKKNKQSSPSTTWSSSTRSSSTWWWWHTSNLPTQQLEEEYDTNIKWNIATQEKWIKEKDYLSAMKMMQGGLEVYMNGWLDNFGSGGEGGEDGEKNEQLLEESDGDGGTTITNTSNNKREDEEEFVKKSLVLAKRLLFLAYCELDGGLISSARQRLVQCISIINTILCYSSSRILPNWANHQQVTAQSTLDDAYMELMLSMEEEEEVQVEATTTTNNNMILARHVANMAITNNNCCGWVHPLQRPGYMASLTPQLSSIPICPMEQRPMWCNELEQNYERILEEYNRLSNALNRGNQWLDVGSGHRGSGHNDHRVISGRGWKEYVLFGTGALDGDDDAPFTKKLLRQHVPDAVSLARDGGGEVIYSRLFPRTHIKAHCGPTNLRWTAHLGLVVPSSKLKSDSPSCRIRVGDEWTSWSVGKVLLFDDSFEHEVRNDADEERVVLLIRVWHPELMSRRRMGLASQLVAEAIAKKEEAVQKRYHPPL